MADYEALFPSRFLKSADLAERDATVAIKSVASEEIDGKDKVIMSFEGTKKQFVCNRTNAEAIRLMLGRDYTTWIGHRITLGRIMMKDPFGGDDAPDIGAIRVRGSPEIDKPMTAEVKRGRKTLKISVRPTGGGKPAAKAPAPGNGKASGEPSEEEKAAILQREREQAATEGFPNS